MTPLLLAIGTDQVGELLLRDDLYDDFCVLPARPEELVARLQHLFWRTGQSMRPDIIEYGPLMLNLETYQAAVSGRVLDLTYMEYELLRFLAGHPAKVFTRETLLSRVWGYEYYGGARTVDVHIRRLRAKLGEEHAHLIQTVRSVGYRFGQVAWHPGVAQRNGGRTTAPAPAAPGRRRPGASDHRRVGPGLDLDPGPDRQRRHGDGGPGRAVVGEVLDPDLVDRGEVAHVDEVQRRLDDVVSVAPSPARTSATFCRAWRSSGIVPPGTSAGAPVPVGGQTDLPRRDHPVAGAADWGIRTNGWAHASLLSTSRWCHSRHRRTRDRRRVGHERAGPRRSRPRQGWRRTRRRSR